MAFYKRTIYLINPSFQIKFSLIVCSLVVLSSIVYPLAIMSLYDGLAKFSPQANTTLQQIRDDLFLFLALFQLFYALLVFVIIVFVTHRIAGPMHKLSVYLQGIASGLNPSHISFRNGDHFSNVATDVNSAFDALTERHRNDLKYLGELEHYMHNLALVVPDDKKPVIHEITTRLKEIHSRANPEKKA